MIERSWPVGVPGLPHIERGFCELVIEDVRPVVHADHLADIRRRGIRVRTRGPVEHGNVMSALCQFESGGGAERSSTHDYNVEGLHLHPCLPGF